LDWKLKQTREGRHYLAVTYSSRNDWNEAIAAGLAGSGMRREHLACIIATPETSSRAYFKTGSGEGFLFST